MSHKSEYSASSFLAECRPTGANHRGCSTTLVLYQPSYRVKVSIFKLFLWIFWALSPNGDVINTINVALFDIRKHWQYSTIGMWWCLDLLEVSKNLLYHNIAAYLFEWFVRIAWLVSIFYCIVWIVTLIYFALNITSHAQKSTWKERRSSCNNIRPNGLRLGIKNKEWLGWNNNAIFLYRTITQPISQQLITQNLFVNGIIK